MGGGGRDGQFSFCPRNVWTGVHLRQDENQGNTIPHENNLLDRYFINDLIVNK